VTVKPINIKELQRQLIDIAARGADARPVLGKVADEFRSDQKANFARGGRPRWKPISPEYAAQKAREGRNGGVGVYTGGLRDSLTRQGDTYHTEKIRPDMLEVGTKNPVANLFNGKHTKHKQPRRKAVSLTPTRRREYLTMVQDYLVEGDL
jgi:phage gpG-like protein